MTTEVELCKQMIGDGIAHGIIVKVGVILALPEWIFFQHYSANSALHKGFPGGKWHWLVFTWVPVEKCGFDMGCEFAKGQVLL